MYDMTDISKIKPNQYIEVMFSTTHHIKKPSSDSVAKEVHRMQIFPGKIARVALTGLTGRLEDGQLFFPGGSAKEFVKIQVFFFDFDNKGESYVSKKSALQYLEKIRFLPNIVFDTYSSSKDCNRFRIGYILTEPIKDEETARHIRTLFWEILDKINPDKQFNTISGVMFGGRNCKIIHDNFFTVAAIEETHKRIVYKVRKGKPIRQQTLMLPTAKGFAYALNLVDTSTYELIKKSNKSCLRLLKANSDPYRMDFDNDIASINLDVLKAAYTLHMKNETHCIDETAHIYAVSVAEVGKFLHKNLYNNNCKTLKATLEKYSRIVAYVNETTLFYAFRVQFEGKVLRYGGKYFDFLKSELFENHGDTQPKERSHNLMMRSSALSGNFYGELLAEQFLQSVLRAGNLKNYSGIMLSTLINRVPQFKCKLDSLRTANEKNIYMKRAFETMHHIIYDSSSFHKVYADWIVTVPTISTKKLYNKILLTRTKNEGEKIDSFLQDMYS